jgi:hypothetical protein
MEGKLEQSQSILGEQREGDKPTAIMKKQQQMTQYLNEKLAGNINQIVLAALSQLLCHIYLLLRACRKCNKPMRR